MSNKDDKFANVPVDKETTILQKKVEKINGIDVLYEYWVWDCFEGESLIFKTEDVAGLSDDDLLEMLPPKKRENIAIVKGKDGYTFVNFGFRNRDGNPLC